MGGETIKASLPARKPKPEPGVPGTGQ